MQPSIRILLAACAAAPLFAACSGGSGAAAGSGVDAIAAQSTSRPLLSLMIAAEDSLRFQGERRVESHWKVGDQRYDLAYSERVSADGQGRFAIEPLDLTQPDLTTSQEDLFLVLSASREAFYWRYRDFRVHDLTRFLHNYVVIDSGQAVQVLGRTCAELKIRRRQDAEIIYHVTVDLQTGLVLRSKEESRDGALIGLCEYQSLNFAPDLTGVAWHQPAVDVTDLADPQHPVEVGLGAHAPHLIGDSFVLISAKKITSSDGGVSTDFAQYTYTDGLEVVFMLYGGNVPVPAGAQQRRPDDLVQIAPSVGPWQLVVATIHGQRLIGMGRLSHGDLLDMVASALE